jgi:hypothetical protein
VAEAFQAERITASHANLIARLPQDFQQQAFEACWRKEYQDKEAHLLPAKHLSAWIANNVYLPLDEAPFDREDATLNPAAVACSACLRRSGYNTSLFLDVAWDQCLDGNCYHANPTEHIDPEVAARPELVRIETDHRNPNERQPGTLSRWEYTEVDAPEVENEDAEVTPCGASKRAIVVYGAGAGTTRTICIDPECPVHHPSRVVPIDPDAEARRKERRLRLKRLKTSLLLAPRDRRRGQNGRWPIHHQIRCRLSKGACVAAGDLWKKGPHSAPPLSGPVLQLRPTVKSELCQLGPHWHPFGMERFGEKH